jgi:triacylglycerol lipase
LETNDFDARTAIFLAAVCRQTYLMFDNEDGAFVVPRQYRAVSTFHAKSFYDVPERFGFILESGDRLVVAFRGTSSPMDWVSDVMAQQKKFVCVPGTGWTHRGIAAVYESARDAVLSALSGLPGDKPLYITGHSLGGALATLCAIDVAAHSHFAQPRVYTFGAPRVGDPAFAKAFNSKIACSHRVCNAYDVVPHLPPFLCKIPRHKKMYSYMHVKRAYPLEFQNGSASANHVIDSYFAALSKLDPSYTTQMCGISAGFC